MLSVKSKLVDTKGNFVGLDTVEMGILPKRYVKSFRYCNIRLEYNQLSNSIPKRVVNLEEVFRCLKEELSLVLYTCVPVSLSLEQLLSTYRLSMFLSKSAAVDFAVNNAEWKDVTKFYIYEIGYSHRSPTILKTYLDKTESIRLRMALDSCINIDSQSNLSDAIYFMDYAVKGISNDYYKGLESMSSSCISSQLDEFVKQGYIRLNIGSKVPKDCFEILRGDVVQWQDLLAYYNLSINKVVKTIPMYADRFVYVANTIDESLKLPTSDYAIEIRFLNDTIKFEITLFGRTVYRITVDNEYNITNVYIDNKDFHYSEFDSIIRNIVHLIKGFNYIVKDCICDIKSIRLNSENKWYFCKNVKLIGDTLIM